jgi:class 3 adenylate cyclase
LIRTLPRKGIRFVGTVREEQKSAPLPVAADLLAHDKKPDVAPGRGEGVAERRQLTVASCELLLAPGALVDPEDLREILRSYHDCVGDVAHRHNGARAHAVGNGVLVYFGSPVAHEDDAESGAGGA